MDILEFLAKAAALVAAIAGAIGALFAMRKKIKEGKDATTSQAGVGDRVSIKAGRDAHYIKDSFNGRN
jgi:hypothetical protein